MKGITILFLAAVLTGCSAINEEKIDRESLVGRHKVHIDAPDSLNSLTVGNGEFAFTVDVSGLQSFPQYYENGMSLGTLSQWAWHSIPTDENYTLEETMRTHESCSGAEVSFPVQHREGRKADAANWLRANPHRLHMGLIGLELIKEDGQPANIHDLQNISQTLDLWTGEITSRYELEGAPIEVVLSAHPSKDQISAMITSPLLATKRIGVKMRFPYGAECHVCPGYDFDSPNRHSTRIVHHSEEEATLQRTLDSTVYFVHIGWENPAELIQDEAHELSLSPSSRDDQFAFSVFFDKKEEGKGSNFNDTQKMSAGEWRKFWSEGAAIDFSECEDPRASELERRIVLSQYLTRVQCAGSLPPQETGLTMNSWYGKFHLEMHWWHGVHFPLWNRKDLLEKSLWWYENVLPEARNTARRQGYEGARWQKMTDPAGAESPSSIGPYLVWQQPHIIYFAELLYRQTLNRDILEKYKNLVFETADFMASLPVFDSLDGKYHLCHPIIPAQELFPAATTSDPPFELAYWHYGLMKACEWSERLGEPVKEKWREVLENLAPLPIGDGLYLPSATVPQSYTDVFYRRDHPAVLGAFGALPSGDMIEPEVMKRTLVEILSNWQWDTTWGWDYPMIAMCAARLNLPEKAVDALFMDLQKNTYLKNGHNYQDERLRLYLPGNGGLLTAAAMMAAGWDGGPDRANPGFPDNGKWKVKWEGLHKMP